MIDKTSNQKSLLENQVNVLFNASLSGGLLNIFAVWLIYTLVFETQHEPNATILAITVTSIAAIRFFITNDYLKKKQFRLRYYLLGYITLTLLMGSAWGVFQYTQTFHDDATVRNIIFLISFGMIAGGVAILSVWLPAYLVYIMPQSVAIFIVFLNVTGDHRHYIAFTFMIYVAVMISTSFKVNKSRRKELELTLHNEQLINDLNDEIYIRKQAQFDLEENKRQLEIKVDERTKDLRDINTNLEKVIEKKEKAEGSLQYLAYHDELTGLPNRNLLIDRINHLSLIHI